MARPRVIQENTDDAVGLFHGNLIYWRDLMRIAQDHQTPRLTSLLWKLGQRITSLGYKLNRRRARQEMERWGIESPTFRAVPTNSGDEGG